MAEFSEEVRALVEEFVEELVCDYDRMRVREFLREKDLPTDTALFGEMYSAIEATEVTVKW